MKVTTVASTYLDAENDPNNPNEDVFHQTQDRKPIITPNISGSTSDGEGQQYLLIPNKREILVKSMMHGQNVCTLVPERNADHGILNTVAIMKLNKVSSSDKDSASEESCEETEWIVLAGFSSGICFEWLLSSIPFSKNNIVDSRRHFSVGVDGCITHVASPSGVSNGEFYALVEKEKQISFIKCRVPSFDEESELKVTSETLCKLSFEKKHQHADDIVSLQSKPFALACTHAIANDGKRDDFICICHRKGLIIYSNEAGDFVCVPKTQNMASICAFAMSPNGKDLALGYTNGKIDILVSILSQTAVYLKKKKDENVKHPSETLVSRTIHWHALPVKTLSYIGQPGSRATPSLLSGGEEAVLVTWSIDRGLNRPTHTLPRITKGCISHIATSIYSDSLDIVIRSMDDSLQLIQGYNHAVRWKVQGLGCSLNECVESVKSSSLYTNPVALHIDPRTQTPILTSMQGAPGLAHWFDPKTGHVVGELEIAPYNRISRKEVHHKSYPRPEITHFAMSNSGNDMITIDSMLSENIGMGKSCRVKSFTSSGDDLSEEMSITSTIKFWSWSREMERNAEMKNIGMPYELVAAMPYPHGLKSGRISSLAISPDGATACTLSNEEGFFHIWSKVKSAGAEGMKSNSGPSVPSWKRLCKIAIPAGYAQVSTNDQRGPLVVFSPDSSVLAIALGKHITLWDHTNATLLNTVAAVDTVQSVQFVRSPMDMLLVLGQRSLSLLPPFGPGYLGSTAWSCGLPKLTEETVIQVDLSNAIAIPSLREIALVMEVSHNSVKSGKVILLDMLTGKAKANESDEVFGWDISATIQSITDISHCNATWRNPNASLLLLTSDNEMLALERTSDEDKKEMAPRGCFARIGNNNSKALTSYVSNKLESFKRKRLDNESMPPSKRADIDITSAVLFSDSTNESKTVPLSTFQLPSLNSSFVRSFVGRHLSKN
jgi:hypothetical protein